MQKNDKDINKDLFFEVIKEKLESYSIQPDKSVWEEIESRLDSKKKINLTPWVAAAAVAACIALLWLVIPFNTQISKNHENEQLSQNEPSVVQDLPEATDVEPVGSSLQEDVRLAFVEKEERTSPVGFSFGIRNEITVEEVIEETADIRPTVVLPETPVEQQPQVKEEDKTKQRLSQEEAERLLYAMINNDQEPLRLTNKKKKGSFGLSIGSGNNYVADNNNPLLSEGNWALRASGPALQKAASDEIKNRILTYKDFEDVSHNAPLSFGLSVRYPFSDRFAIESGLTYTYLSTSFKNKSPKRDATLRLHYLGIPINAVANVYETGRWRFYVLAGGMIEKGIYSYFAQNEYDDDGNGKIKTVSPDKGIDGVQLSIHIAPGAEFKFDNNYSIYIEPRAAYYFDNNQPVSIRTKHPFNLGVSAGVRFTL